MTPANIESLRKSFSGRLLIEDADMAPFLTDWRGLWEGSAWAVAQPDTAADAAAIVRWCAESGTPITPQGGNTSLSGGAVPDSSGKQIVLSLARLNRVRDVDLVNNTMTVEAGCILQTVQNIANDHDRLFPLSLAAEGSCTIGGNLATNAGGTGVLRFGNARELCLGLEVVTADGELWDGLRGLRKDNTGYDLRDIFIGSEGTLGVITAAVLKLHPRPVSKAAAFVAVSCPDDALGLLAIAQARLGQALSGFELISDASLNLVIRHVPGARSPLESAAPWYVLIEVLEQDDAEPSGASLLEKLLEAAFEKEFVSDGVVSSSLAQFNQLWALRENISEAQGLEGPAVKHDVALPISNLSPFIESASQALSEKFPSLRLVIFGHLGDGNLHFNVSPPEEGMDKQSLLEKQGAINTVVHDLVMKFGGSISAEHGLGVLRRDEAASYKTAVEMKMMRSVKNAFDPANLMNPGKVLA